MPQLDFSTYAPQLIWLAISFGLLYLIMARVALPRIATVLEERRDRIADDLDKAEQLARQSKAAEAAYEKDLADARRRAHAIARDTRAALLAETGRQRLEAEAEMARKLVAAELRIAETKEAAMAGVRQASAEVARAIVEQMIDLRTDNMQP